MGKITQNWYGKFWVKISCLAIVRLTSFKTGSVQSFEWRKLWLNYLGFYCLIGAIIARMIYELAAPTADMNAPPGVLRTRILRRTVQVRLRFKSLRMSGSTPIFTVSRQQFVNHPG
jgi:hypothetical protein